MVNKKSIRAAIFAAAGIYLAYTAYSLFAGRHSNEAMRPWLTYLFVALFLGSAIAIFIYAFKLWKAAKEEQAELERQIAEEEETEKRPASGTGSEGDEKQPSEKE